MSSFFAEDNSHAGILAAILLAISLLSIVVAVRSRRFILLVFAAVPYLVIGVQALQSMEFRGTPLVGMLLFNAYLLALGVTTIALGIREASLAKMNLGMLIMAVTIIVRFFDFDIGILPRGFAFIAIGACFMGVNALLMKRAKSKAAAQLEEATE